MSSRSYTVNYLGAGEQPSTELRLVPKKIRMVPTKRHAVAQHRLILMTKKQGEHAVPGYLPLYIIVIVSVFVTVSGASGYQ
ncbi:unnamed protein product [Amoebophrya sp. A25]|nr:unnamed protein product [Amoebophrya sp. A25]|eukprot:GSA25T00016140001.1